MLDALTSPPDVADTLANDSEDTPDGDGAAPIMDASADGGEGGTDTYDADDTLDANDTEDACGECGDATVCKEGACVPIQCEPGESLCTNEGLVSKCDPFGADFYTFPCATGFACHKGFCKPPAANVLLVFDTSGSMDDAVAQGTMQGWPSCEDPEHPVTKMGVSKAAFTAALAEELENPVRFALLRFAQDAQFTNSPNCSNGYYDPLDGMTGDDGKHHTGPSEDWLSENLDEVVIVPFASDDSDTLPDVLLWMDGAEAIEEEPEIACADCPGMCGGSTCYVHTNPELRPSGWTPLGKTLFYAGEYIRRFVLIEGKPCEIDTDCDTAHHTCVDGACHDPLEGCRQTMVLMFTDGGETENSLSTDFFNPVNQAKRLRMGLSCANGESCTEDATCDGGLCLLKVGNTTTAEVLSSEDVGLCSEGMKTCELELFTGCDTGFCTQVALNEYVDSMGVQGLPGWNGDPLAVTVHVIDAAPQIESTNLDMAFWGGGEYLKVDASDATSIMEAISTLTDVKPNLGCQ